MNLKGPIPFFPSLKPKLSFEICGIVGFFFDCYPNASMSLILALNTASRESAIALLNEHGVLEEVTWESQSRGSEQVLPRLEEMLALYGKNWKDLSSLVVVKGPGPYTSLRVGISIINSMAWVLKIPIRTVSVFELWKSRLPDDEKGKEYTVMISAGRTHYILEGESSPRGSGELDMNRTRYMGELPAEHPGPGFSYKSFGEGFLVLEPSQYEDLPIGVFAEPVYSRPPLVTVAKTS
ncbi:MAG: M22 family peptidase [Candidatus Peregrinibacteria bacterium GW2011_GWA2_44_7]|nr:MAG: M22 family peptidase [Candidatus Peregrinibacteria bacterium GW2011_GWA2_44_7]